MSDSIFDQSKKRLGSLASQIHARRHKAMTADELAEILNVSRLTTYLVDGHDAVYLLRLLGHQGASYDAISKVLTADREEGRQLERRE
jgi:hypothetical protein